MTKSVEYPGLKLWRRKVPESAGKRQKVPESAGMRQNVPECAGMYRKVPESAGKCRTVLRDISNQILLVD